MISITEERVNPMSSAAGCLENLRETHSEMNVNSRGRTKDFINGWSILVLYRYISWFLTSVFYLLGTDPSLIRYKMVVIVSLLVYSILIIYLYEHSKETALDKVIVVAVETLGIALFLLPTGGLESDFIWYALNPIFMAAILLPGIYCWGILIFFLASASLESILFKDIKLLEAWQNNHWLLLVFLLLTTIAHLFTKLIRQLSEAYDKLAVLYSTSERLLQHHANLYQALESFSAGESPGHLADLLATYARKLTDSQATVCYLSQSNEESQWAVADPDGIFADNHMNREYLDDIWHQLNDRQQKYHSLSFEIGCKNHLFICIPLLSLGSRFGFLGYIATEQTTVEDSNKTVGFLAELGAVALERQKTDELSARLMVSEEQNRIANEIHDGVSQYLFSIVYALHGLSRKKGSLQESEIQHQLNLISNTANKAAKELRASIYSISPRRRGEQVFVAGLSSYLEGLAQLNDVEVNFQTTGSEETLSPALQKALYRIVRESTSNAIRHGKCSTIKIKLHMEPSKVFLEIIDNGEGFDAVSQARPGLGLVNMSSLMASFKGRLTIQSGYGKGTRVICTVPDN